MSEWNGPDWTIRQGDCLELLKSLPSGSVDAVVTDPPYGVDWNTDYTRFSSEFAQQTKYARVASDKKPFDPTPWLSFRRVVMFGANCFSNRLPMGSWLVWDKRFPNGSAFLADGEAAWMNGGHGVYIKSITQQGCIRPERAEHPTQKPIELMKWCLDMAKIPVGATVLDPFMGSGTTGVACIQTGRKFIGFELDRKYCEIAARRIADVGPLFRAACGGVA